MVKNTELKEIKRIGVMSLGKISVLFGLIMGVLAAIAILLTGTGSIDQNNLDNLNVPTWGVALFVLIYYPIASFLAGILSAAIYNGLVKLVGGIKVSLD